MPHSTVRKRATNARPEVGQIDRVQELSYKGLPRELIAAEIGIDERLLARWSEESAEIRDALSVSDAIHLFHAPSLVMQDSSRLPTSISAEHSVDVQRQRRRLGDSATRRFRVRGTVKTTGIAGRPRVAIRNTIDGVRMETR